MAATEPLPGTSDIWEPEVLNWVTLENTARDVFQRYSFTELRTPIFEKTNIFVHNLGNETDVVQKEMYTFQDRGGRSLTLRPEGTAGVIRAIANKGLNQGEESRVFYFGPMFRGERPAAGRRRQFHQVGVETVGANSPWTDAEIIAMLVHYLEEIGISGSKVSINTRGLPSDRPKISAALKEYFTPFLSEMCDDCKRRIETNVWRILDCKQPRCHEIAVQAPNILEMMCQESQDYFRNVCAALEKLGIHYEIAPRLVRGLDYYMHTVFEITHEGLGAQDALAGGGRYQIELPGNKKPLEGIGFAAGMERLLIARDSLNLNIKEEYGVDTYIVSLGENAILAGLKLAAQLRKQRLGGRIKADSSARSMKAQMRSANRENARIVLIQGDDEIAKGIITCRNMKTSDQQSIPITELSQWLSNNKEPIPAE